MDVLLLYNPVAHALLGSELEYTTRRSHFTRSIHSKAIQNQRPCNTVPLHKTLCYILFPLLLILTLHHRHKTNFLRNITIGPHTCTACPSQPNHLEIRVCYFRALVPPSEQLYLFANGKDSMPDVYRAAPTMHELHLVVCRESTKPSR